ncbi:MAG: tetratricopeptide repeat protein [Planctomycetota bacterium]|nr:tetratricopeptide repeat protein [Planctomycetota bacterium]
MERTRRFGSLLIAMAFPFCAASAGSADEIILKDGRKIRGEVVSEGDELVVAPEGGGTPVRVRKTDVLLHAAESPAAREYRARLAKLDPRDARAHYELGLWAREKGLAKEAAEEFRRVLETDPFHEGAGRALGYARNPDGRWVTPAEISRAEEGGKKTGGPGADAKEVARVAEAVAKFAPLLGSNQDVEAREKAAGELIGKARENPDLFIRLLREGVGGRALPEQARCAIVEIGRRSADRRFMDAFLERVVYDPDPKVRRDTARALPSLDEPVALRRLIDLALQHENREARRRAAEAIRRFGSIEGIRRLMSEMSLEIAGGNPWDPKNPVRGSKKPMGIAEVDHIGLPSTQRPDVRDIYRAYAALVEVTGVDMGLDPRAWTAWWKANQATFQFKD